MRYILGLFMLLAVCSGPALGAEPEPLGTVKGRIEAPGMANYRGIAALWEAREGIVPDPRKYVIIPAAVNPLGPDGRFSIKARPGDYFVGAVLRKTPGPTMGPPRPGDLVFMSPDAAGKALQVKVALGATIDVGTHGAAWTYAGLEAWGGPRIEGRIIDTEGLPVAGLLVFAFGDSNMSEHPLAVSERSDAEGRFQVRLPRSTTVYLRVRPNYGQGSPMQGGYTGVFGGQVPKPLVVPAAEALSGVNIEVMEIPPLGERRKQGLRGPRTLKESNTK